MTKPRILSQRFFLVRWRADETYEVFDHANDEWIACEWTEDIGTHIGAMLRAKPPKRARAGTDARGGIPVAKLRAVAAAIRRYPWREDTAGVARVAIKAADAWDSAQRLAAGPQPARERDTDAWWAD